MMTQMLPYLFTFATSAASFYYFTGDVKMSLASGVLNTATYAIMMSAFCTISEC